MKDLSIYFQPYNLKSVNNFSGLLQDIQPSHGKTAIAILSVPEYRNANINNEEVDASAVVNELLKLYPNAWQFSLSLLGTILPGNSIQDTYGALKEVVTELVKQNVIPVILGGSQDLIMPIYTAFENLEQTVNIVDFNTKPNIGDPDNELTSEGWLSHVLKHTPSFLFNYSLIGYQNYLSNPAEIELLNQLYFDAERLGNFYGNESHIEPLVRNADIMMLNLDVIRSSDYPDNSKSLPHGFYGEDACKVMRYAGISDKLSVACLFSHNQIESDQSINLKAQLIWHLLDGIHNRRKDYPIGSKDKHIKYRVNIDDFKDEVIFHKSPVSGRWWMEVPQPEKSGNRFSRHLLVPCNYDDYLNALKNDLPNLWWKTHQKLI